MRRFNARFELGSWQCWGLDPQEEALRNNQMPWHTDYPKAGKAQTAQRYRPDKQSAIASIEDNCEPGHYQNYFRALATAIITRSQPPVSLSDACALIYTLELAERSSAEGKRLRWQYP
jgi:predicted dehydrogenase